jgi:hypothetical protein
MIAVSSNGKSVAFALEDRTIRIRDVATGAETDRLTGNAWWLLFGPDSHTLFGLANNGLKTWKAGADGRWTLAHFRKLDVGNRNVSLGVNQYLVLSEGDKDQRIDAFAWEDDKPLASVILDKDTHIDKIYVAHDRKRIVAIGSKEADNQHGGLTGENGITRQARPARVVP